MFDPYQNTGGAATLEPRPAGMNGQPRTDFVSPEQQAYVNAMNMCGIATPGMPGTVVSPNGYVSTPPIGFAPVNYGPQTVNPFAVNPFAVNPFAVNPFVVNPITGTPVGQAPLGWNTLNPYNVTGLGGFNTIPGINGFNTIPGVNGFNAIPGVHPAYVGLNSFGYPTQSPYRGIPTTSFGLPTVYPTAGTLGNMVSTNPFALNTPYGQPLTTTIVNVPTPYGIIPTPVVCPSPMGGSFGGLNPAAVPGMISAAPSVFPNVPGLTTIGGIPTIANTPISNWGGRMIHSPFTNTPSAWPMNAWTNNAWSNPLALQSGLYGHTIPNVVPTPFGPVATQIPGLGIPNVNPAFGFNATIPSHRIANTPWNTINPFIGSTPWGVAPQNLGVNPLAGYGYPACYSHPVNPAYNPVPTDVFGMSPWNNAWMQQVAGTIANPFAGVNGFNSFKPPYGNPIGTDLINGLGAFCNPMTGLCGCGPTSAFGVPSVGIPGFGIPGFGIPGFGVPSFGVNGYGNPGLSAPWAMGNTMLPGFATASAVPSSCMSVGCF